MRLQQSWLVDLLIFIDEYCFSFFITFIEKSLDENKESKKNDNLAQDKFTERLNVLNEFIASLVDLEKKIGLASERKLILKHFWEREATKKKLKQFKSLVKGQRKLRGKRKQAVKELARDHPEIGYILKITSSKKDTRVALLWVTGRELTWSHFSNCCSLINCW